MKLSDKVAIITGASRGIGESIAIALAEQGCTVMLAARDKVALADICARINSDGGRGMWYCCVVGFGGLFQHYCGRRCVQMKSLSP